MAWDPIVSGRLGVNAPNGQAVLALSVAAGTRTLDLFGYANFVPGPSVNSDFGVGVYVDGAWSTELTPAANGLWASSVALDGSAHSIDVVSAYQNYHTNTTALGNWLTGYQGATLRTVAAPTRRLVCYGDSIVTGAFAQPVAEFSWFARTRAVYPGRISGEMYGGRQLLDDTNGTSGGFANVTALAARLVALVQLGGTTTTREAWLAIGYNDWHNTTMTAAAFATNLAALCDAIHAADSTVLIYLQSILITGTEATTNGNAELPSAFRSAAVTASTGRAFVTSVSGTALMSAGGLNADGVHPSTNGHASIFDGSGGFAGSTNVRTVLGI